MGFESSRRRYRVNSVEWKSYQCSCCNGWFDFTRTAEETLREREDLFPDTPHDEFVLVCEGCFVNIMMNAHDSGVLIDERYKDYLGDQ